MRGSGDPGPWVDSDYVLQSGLPRFRWAGVGVSIAPKKPPSIFNSHTYLRIARRRGRWVAMLWDKRDDDLVPFDNLPVTLSLTKGGRRATVTLRSHYWMYAPPAVPLAEVAFTGDQHRPVSITLTSPQRVWRVRMAAFSYLPSDPNHAPAVTMMLDVGFERHFVTTGSQARLSWSPRGRTTWLLAQYCTPTGASRAGTSLWVEDELGHVAVPDKIVWSGPAPVASSDGRLWHTIRQPNAWTGLGDVTGVLRPAGPVIAVAAAGTAGQAHFLYATGNGDVYHAIRNDNGSWSAAGDVKSQVGNPGLVVGVAAAATSALGDPRRVGHPRRSAVAHIAASRLVDPARRRQRADRRPGPRRRRVLRAGRRPASSTVSS